LELEKLNYQSEGLINKELSYELSALLVADSLFYGVLDYNRRLRKANFKNLDHSVIGSIESEYTIRKTKVGILSRIFTILPSHEFSSSFAHDFIEHTHLLNNENNYLIRNDYCEKFNLRVVYAVLKEDLDFLQSSFDTPILYHFITTAIENLDTSRIDNEVRVVLLDGIMIVTVHNGTKLMMANVYDYYDTASFLYFISLTFRQLDLDHAHQLITLSGMIDQPDEMVTTMKRYYGNVQIAEGGILTESNMPTHYYHPLYCVSKCG
jgi:uridine kinase